MSDAFVPLDPGSQLGYLVVRLAAQVERPWSGALGKAGINPRQFSMLACLAQDPGISQGELARRVMITPQSASEALSALYDAGWIDRGDVEPGRAARLHLTIAGRRLLAKAYPIVERTNRESFATLTDAERRELGRILRKLLDQAP